jgi:hypothetical protein
MKTPIHTPARQILAVLALVAVALVAMNSSLAQNTAAQSVAAPINDYLYLSFTSIKPERITEFERLVKEELNPALRKSGLTARYVSTRATIGDGYVYVGARPFTRLAEFDEPDRLSKALGEKAAQALLEKLRACHSAHHSIIVRNVGDASWGTDEVMPMYMVAKLQLATGRKADWLKFQREEHVPLLRKTGLKTYFTQEVVYGGDQNVVYTLTRFDKYSELDVNRVRQHLGDQAYTQFNAKRPSGAVTSVERTLWRLRPELSIVPEPKAKATQ